MSALLSDIETYWTNRAPGYSAVNQEELRTDQNRKWSRLLRGELPDGEPRAMRILDCGTGPGFFAIILARYGYQVSAVDYTQEMLNQARYNAMALADRIDFQRMDAQDLRFPDNTFDAVVSRNLTWVLEHPERAYEQWYRVLKPGGVLLNFDANWYRYLYDEELKQAYEDDRLYVKHCKVTDFNDGTDTVEMERIARQVPLSRVDRPVWDLRVMKRCGFSSALADLRVGESVLSEVEKINFRSTPIFMIRGVK